MPLAWQHVWPAPATVLQGTKINSKGKEMPHGTRLYSIAASRYGDDYDGKTTSLCVRRATFWDSEKNAEDPAKKGICSNFLCDAKPGDEITMTGLCLGTADACHQPDVFCSKPLGGQAVGHVHASLQLLNMQHNDLKSLAGLQARLFLMQRPAPVPQLLPLNLHAPIA